MKRISIKDTLLGLLIVLFLAGAVAQVATVQYEAPGRYQVSTSAAASSSGNFRNFVTILDTRTGRAQIFVTSSGGHVQYSLEDAAQPAPTQNLR
jgi:hypothetical protein